MTGLSKKTLLATLAIIGAAWLAYALFPQRLAPKVSVLMTPEGIVVKNRAGVMLRNLTATLDGDSQVKVEALKSGDTIGIPCKLFGKSPTMTSKVRLQADSDSGEVAMETTWPRPSTR